MPKATHKSTEPAQAPDSPHAELFAKVKTCIDERIRPFIQMDGGDIEVLEMVDGPLDDKGKPTHKILRIELHGACVGCMASSFTLQYGVQNAINEEFPDEDIMLEQVNKME